MKIRIPHPARLMAGAALFGALGSAGAQMQPQPQNVVSLNASASVEVNKDWLTVVFSTTREGREAAQVQAELRQALDAALKVARQATKPGQLEVETGAFSLFPRHAAVPVKGSAAPQVGIVGWQGSTELIVQGRDTEAISRLTGRIQTLSIGRVGFSLSREAREKVEGDVTAEAISRFRARADAVSRQFGFAGYAVREVSVTADGALQAPPVMRMRTMAAADSEAALPVEAGKATVTATVSGSVQMR
jgi:predicted secreted protein